MLLQGDIHVGDLKFSIFKLLFIYNTYNQPFNIAWKNYGI